MFYSQGIMQYGPGMRAAVLVDKDISRYYKWWIPKWYYPQPQLYPPHITVVRGRLELSSNINNWMKYQGYKIPFVYDSTVFYDGTYFYLKVWSEFIGMVREELGLPKYRFNDIERECYHITIANTKGN